MSESTTAESETRNRFRKSWILSLIFGMACAVATWAITRSTYPYVAVGSQYDIGMGASNEQRLALLSEQDRVDRINASIVFGIGGALLATVLSFFSNCRCGFALTIVSAITSGAVAGALSGFVGSFLFNLILPRDSFPNATNTGFAHAAVFGLFGLLQGAIFGLHTRNVTRCVSSASIGALAGSAGGVLFPIVTGIIVPQISITGLVQTSIAGLVWLMLPFAFIATLVPSVSNRSKPQPIAQ